MDNAKPKRKGRQKTDISGYKYTPDQLRIKLQKYCQKKRIVIPRDPVKGTSFMGSSLPKSTTISMREVSMISEIDNWRLFSFKSCKTELFPAELRRLINAIDLIESGRVVKTQAGKYTIHDEPVLAPVKTLHVCLDTLKIAGNATVAKAPAAMPSFKKLFG